MVAITNLTAYGTPYAEFDKAFQQILASHINGGVYKHVSASRTSKKMAEGPVGDYKAYIHMLVRPPDIQPTGHRNLELGRLEVGFVIKAPFNNPHDYSSGIDLNILTDPGCMRLCIGPNLGLFDKLVKTLVDEWKALKPSLARNIHSGTYACAARQLTTLVEESLNKFKLAEPARVLEGRIRDGLLVF